MTPEELAEIRAWMQELEGENIRLRSLTSGSVQSLVERLTEAEERWADACQRDALRARAERLERDVERLREERAALHRALGDALHIASYAPDLVGFEEAEEEARRLWESLKNAVGKDGA